jgi:hypothetical protein
MVEKTQRSYIGKSGQMAVMAELLARGCNVAIPEIDVGEDLFTFRDGRENVDRIQVKTANARRLRRSDRYIARISVPLAQLEAEDEPILFHVFPIRLEGQWTDFVVISRSDLKLRQDRGQIGSVNAKSGELQLRLGFDPVSLTCKGSDLSRFRNAWNLLPILQP